MIFARSSFKTFSFITLTLSNSVKVSPKIVTRFISISMAMTLPAFSAAAAVKTPIPGPISITKSSLVISAPSTIPSITSLFVKKFCPKLLENLNLYLFFIPRITEGLYSSIKLLSCYTVPV